MPAEHESWWYMRQLKNNTECIFCNGETNVLYYFSATYLVPSCDDCVDRLDAEPNVLDEAVVQAIAANRMIRRRKKERFGPVSLSSIPSLIINFLRVGLFDCCRNTRRNDGS